MNSRSLIALLALALAAPLAQGLTPGSVDAVLAKRFDGDRSGACLVAAVIEIGRVERGAFCADAARRIGPEVAFEIGSVTKTMMGALLAGLIAEGRVTLDTPLAEVLPPGSVVPSFEGQPITLRHLLTHTAGLPPLPANFVPADPTNPYADHSEAALLAGLAQVRLEAAPGSGWAYSNFGAMLLSAVISRLAGMPFPELARERLFAPLGMAATHVGEAPATVVAVAGRRPGGQVVPGWTFAAPLAGVGGVRSSLDDLVRYVQAQLGEGDAPTVALVRAAQQPMDNAGPPMAMGWMIASLNGRTLYLHDGGTGGFSSFVAFDRDALRGVVVLVDTATASLDGLDGIGLPLLDDRVPVGKPRRLVQPPQALLDRLVGDYSIGERLPVSLRQRDGVLYIQAVGQPEFKLGYDSAGDFFPEAFDARLTPTADGFLWVQGGAAIPATVR